MPKIVRNRLVEASMAEIAHRATSKNLSKAGAEVMRAAERAAERAEILRVRKIRSLVERNSLVRRKRKMDNFERDLAAVTELHLPGLRDAAREILAAVEAAPDEVKRRITEDHNGAGGDTVEESARRLAAAFESAPTGEEWVNRDAQAAGIDDVVKDQPAIRGAINTWFNLWNAHMDDVDAIMVPAGVIDIEDTRDGGEEPMQPDPYKSARGLMRRYIGANDVRSAIESSLAEDNPSEVQTILKEIAEGRNYASKYGEAVKAAAAEALLMIGSKGFDAALQDFFIALAEWDSSAGGESHGEMDDSYKSARGLRKKGTRGSPRDVEYLAYQVKEACERLLESDKIGGPEFKVVNEIANALHDYGTPRSNPEHVSQEVSRIEALRQKFEAAVDPDDFDDADADDIVDISSGLDDIVSSLQEESGVFDGRSARGLETKDKGMSDAQFDKALAALNKKYLAKFKPLCSAALDALADLPAKIKSKKTASHAGAGGKTVEADVKGVCRTLSTPTTGDDEMWVNCDAWLAGIMDVLPGGELKDALQALYDVFEEMLDEEETLLG